METCEWILARSWHVHHHPMLIRKWRLGIDPLDLSPKAKPTWITFCKVPPTLLTEEGVNWLASQYGKPIHKHVREGLNVKVCILRGERSNVNKELKNHLGKGEMVTIAVEFPSARGFRSTEKVYKPVSQPTVIANDEVLDDTSAETSKGVEVEVTEDIHDLEAGGGQGSGSKTSDEVEDHPSQIRPAETSSEVEVRVTQSPITGIQVHASAFEVLVEDGVEGNDICGSEKGESAASGSEKGESAVSGGSEEGGTEVFTKIPEKPYFGEFLQNGTHFSTRGRGKGRGSSGVKTRQQTKK
ncbi:hypothetical protein LINPERHAP1_LOCUS7355 [Linum perenne]